MTRLTGADVADGKLLAEDFAPGQLPKGARGDAGDPGSKGDKGDPGISGLGLAAGDPIAFDACSPKSAVVTCSPGKRVLSVGTGSAASSAERPYISGLTGGATASGIVTMVKNDGQNFSFSAAAVCASFTP